MVSDILDQFKYTHDPVGNIIQIDKYRVDLPIPLLGGVPEGRGGHPLEMDNGLFNYAYDPLNRLVEATHGDNTKTYGYDNLGNRISSVHNGVQTNHTFNARNQLVTTVDKDMTIKYNYDKRGNLTQVTENGIPAANYTFDTTNMMVAATTGNGTAEYAYNGFRKRVSKLESLHSVGTPYMASAGEIPDPTTEVRYILDLTRPYDDLLATQGVQNQSFVWGNSLLSANSTDNSFHYLQDHLGSPIRLLGNDNAETMAYDEFGVPEILANITNFNNPFGFTGYQTDKISELYYAQARYYSPTSGRFFAEDPIKDRLNWYGYCNANPIAFIDPTGLAEDHVGAGANTTTGVQNVIAVNENGVTTLNNVEQPYPFIPVPPSGDVLKNAMSNLVNNAATSTSSEALEKIISGNYEPCCVPREPARPMNYAYEHNVGNNPIPNTGNWCCMSIVFKPGVGFKKVYSTPAGSIEFGAAAYREVKYLGDGEWEMGDGVFTAGAGANVFGMNASAQIEGRFDIYNDLEILYGAGVTVDDLLGMGAIGRTSDGGYEWTVGKFFFIGAKVTVKWGDCNCP